MCVGRRERRGLGRGFGRGFVFFFFGREERGVGVGGLGEGSEGGVRWGFLGVLVRF